MTFLANSKPLLFARITEPLIGAWTAEIEVDSDDDLGSKVTLELGSRNARFSATVVRGAVEHGRWIGLLVGGAGGLGRDVESKHYTSVPAKTVLDGLMGDSGESLDSAIARPVLDHSLRAWLRPNGPPTMALDDLSAKVGVSWRVLRSGRIWLGSETWPSVSMPHVEVSRGPSAGTLSVAPAEAPLVRPGTTFSGVRVSHVVTTLRGGELLQQIWTYESRGDRIKAALGELIRQLIGNQIDYSKTWPATVVSQAANGTVEVVPDDERIRGLGLKSLPIRHGLPGTKVKVANGARCRVCFDAADPTRPYAAHWDEGAVLEVALANGTLPNARQGDMTASPLTPQNVIDLAAHLVLTPPTTIAANPAVLSAAIAGTPLTPPVTVRGVVSSGRSAVKS